MRARDLICTCPRCGTPLPSITLWSRVILGLLVFVAFIGFGLLLIVAEMYAIFWLVVRMATWGPD